MPNPDPSPIELSPELFLPEVAPREVKYTVISVDDHVCEPPHTFEGRLPASLQERAPRIVETDEGHQVWEFEGQRHFQVGANAVAGRRRDAVTREPFRFDQMRPSCYDADARVHDMAAQKPSYRCARSRPSSINRGNADSTRSSLSWR